MSVHVVCSLLTRYVVGALRADGVQFEGARLRVEMSRGGDRGGDRGGGGGGDRGGYGGRDDYGGGRGPPRRDFDDRRGPPPRRGPPRDLRRSEHRVIVSGLPVSASWQDLKDFFRQAGDVIYSDVDRHGGGIVEFASKSDQEYAITKLDDTEFVSEYRNQGEKVRAIDCMPCANCMRGEPNTETRGQSTSVCAH